MWQFIWWAYKYIFSGRIQFINVKVEVEVVELESASQPKRALRSYEVTIQTPGSQAAKHPCKSSFPEKITPHPRIQITADQDNFYFVFFYLPT